MIRTTIQLQILVAALCLAAIAWNLPQVTLLFCGENNDGGECSSSQSHREWTLLLPHNRTGDYLQRTPPQHPPSPPNKTMKDGLDLSMNCKDNDGDDTDRGYCRRPVIDVLSTGSMTRPEYQVAQRDVLSRHLSVRHYFSATEGDDTERNCHERLNWTQVKMISQKCRNWKIKQHVPLLARLVNGFARIRFLQQKANPAGWMCAQKRPLTALWQVLKHYTKKSAGQLLPDYLIMLDDDTWLQMDTLVEELLRDYPPHRPSFISGCQIKFKRDNFTIPFGGYGMIWTRAALERWMQPLVGCHPFARRRQQQQQQQDPTNTTAQSKEVNSFAHYACDRYQQYHRLGERIRPGDFSSGMLWGQVDGSGSGGTPMTVADILNSYVQRANYTQVEDWDAIGYCLHSDWAMGYFAAEYQVTDPMEGFRDSHIAKNVRTGECMHVTQDQCWSNATICHYMTPEGMRERIVFGDNNISTNAV